MLYGLSEAAISQRVKKLRINVTRHVGLERAKEVADHAINVAAQLRQINDAVSTELEWALREARKPDGDRKGLQDVITNLASEVRKQLGTALEIARTLYDLRAAAEFQQEVLDAIEEAAPEVRQRIVARLHERRALRSAVLPPG